MARRFEERMEFLVEHKGCIDDTHTHTYTQMYEYIYTYICVL